MLIKLPYVFEIIIKKQATLSKAAQFELLVSLYATAWPEIPALIHSVSNRRHGQS